MPTLSVVMIVKNEAHRLPDCLGGVRPIANEIVIGDTGSMDDTMAVAARFGARIMPIPWRDDYAEARNRVLAAATGDWLLHIDADEALDPDGANRIREIVEADGMGADAIEVTLANYSNDMRAWRWVAADPKDYWARGYAGYIPVGLLRLFRNHRGFEYREAVHENITESVRERKGVIRVEPVVLHHYGYADDPARSQAKATFYRAIAEQKVRQRPQDPKVWLDLAEQSFACGDATSAEYACRKVLELLPLDLAASTLLGNLLLNRGHLQDARALFEELERAGVSAPHIGTVLGAIAYKQGRLAEARHRLEGVLSGHPKTIQAWLYLARARDCLGDPEMARKCLMEALHIAPGLDELRRRVSAHDLRREAEAHFRSGETMEGLRKLTLSLQADPEDPVTHNDIGTVLAALGESEKAKESFQRALLLAPGLSEARQNLDALGG